MASPKKKAFGASAGQHGAAAAAKKRSRGRCAFCFSFISLLVAALAVAGSVVPPTLKPPDGVESWLMVCARLAISHFILLQFRILFFSSHALFSFTQFDGVCNLCDGFVNFVADHDAEMRVKVGAQQKHEDLLKRVGAPLDLSTVVLIQGDVFYTKSTAALRTLALMDQPFNAMSGLMLIPEALRDIGYDLVAKYRYAVFGKVDECRKPSGDFRKRFIDYRPEEEAPINPISEQPEA